MSRKGVKTRIKVLRGLGASDNKGARYLIAKEIKADIKIILIIKPLIDIAFFWLFFSQIYLLKLKKRIKQQELSLLAIITLFRNVGEVGAEGTGNYEIMMTY